MPDDTQRRHARQITADMPQARALQRALRADAEQEMWDRAAMAALSGGARAPGSWADIDWYAGKLVQRAEAIANAFVAARRKRMEGQNDE